MNHNLLLFFPTPSCLPAVGPVFDCVEAYAPGFKGSVVGRDVLTPPDLERIFGLPGGVRIHLGGPSSHFSLCNPAAHTAFIGREDSDRDHGEEGTEEGAGLGSKGREGRCRQERRHLLRRSQDGGPSNWTSTSAHPV